MLFPQPLPDIALLRVELLQLGMRVGVNTGLALLGTVATTGEFSVIGDAVNTASRLEQAAPVNTVLISHDTYRHVRGVFDLQTLEPITVKGKSEPLQIYQVQRARPRAFRMRRRGVQGVETRLIGREEELEQLKAILQVAGVSPRMGAGEDTRVIAELRGRYTLRIA